MSFWRDLFSYKGRLSRGGYWAYNLSLGLAIYLLSFSSILFEAYGFYGGQYLQIVVLFLILFMLWPLSAVIVKRGHDRGKPAWFSLLLFFSVFFLAAVQRFAPWPLIVALARIAITIYIFVDYACLPRRKGAGRYGGAPDAHSEARPLVLG